MERGGNNRIRSRVAEYMAKHGMILKDLERMSGVSIANLCRIRSGRAMPRVHTAIRVAMALGASVEELWGDNMPDVDRLWVKTAGANRHRLSRDRKSRQRGEA